MNIILFKSTTCPQCKVAKMKLEKKGLPFTEEMDMNVMAEYGVNSIPTLFVNGEKITGIRNISNWIDAQEV